MNIKELIINREYRVKYGTIKDLYTLFSKKELKKLVLDNTIRLKDNYAYFNPNKIKTEIEPFPYVYDIFKEKVTKGEKLYMLDGEHNHKKKK